MSAAAIKSLPDDFLRAPLDLLVHSASPQNVFRERPVALMQDYLGGFGCCWGSDHWEIGGIIAGNGIVRRGIL